MIIQDGTELADYQGKLQSGRSERAKTRGKIVRPVTTCTAQAFLEDLEAFHLDQGSKRELTVLFELLRHRKSGKMARPVRYGMLLECDMEDYGKEFLLFLSQRLQYYGLLEEVPSILEECQHVADDYDSSNEEYTIDEMGGLVYDLSFSDDDVNDFDDSDEGYEAAPEEFSASYPRHAEDEKSSLRIVLGCRPLPVLDKLASSSTRDDIEKTIHVWEYFWEQEEERLKKHPNAIGVAIVSKTVVRSTWKRYEHLFFRVYSHHVRLEDVTVKDIQDMAFRELRKLNLRMDDGFVDGLKTYIQVVYPKADLKIKAFVSDLTDRILTAYYSVHDPEDCLTARCIPFYRQPKTVDDIMAKLNSLVGLETVKEAVQELYYQNQGRKDSKTPLRLSMAFVGNPGTGKTTIGRMMADLLYTMGLIRKNKLVVAKPADLISPWVGQTAIQTHDICQSAYDGVLFIDEAYTLTYSSESGSNSERATGQCVDALLREMEENADRLVVIFAGYPGPIQRFLDSNEGLRSRVTRTIHFPDYSEEELLQIFQRACEQEQFTVDKEAYGALKARIAFEKSSENFGNARSIENAFQSIRAAWQKEPNDGRVFTKEHIQSTMPEQHASDIGSMIGLEEIKEQLRQFERRVKYLQVIGEKGVQTPPMNLHMLFTGNPGTGKTTVARVIAEDLYQIGVLKTNKCICVEARDLISDWSSAGQRTEREIQRAMGGVLFLDEAYALTEYASGSVGREVVATMITAMEKYRGELLVILAGYPNNMRAFLNVNPGLTSRIGHTFHFRDYSVRELTDMFLTKMRKYGYLLTDGVAEQVEQLMEYFHVVPDFGNGRFVDNVIDQTITRRSMRDEDDLCRYNEITAADVPDVKTLLDSMPDGDRFRDPAKITREEKRRTAVHEIGHALVSLLLEPETELSNISISSQAYSYGRVQMQRSGGNLTEEQLMNTISIALGGRNAERAVFGNHSTGCASDYATAKAVAKDMLERYAMGPALGARNITPLLEKADQVTVRLLERHKESLLALSDQLLEKQELTDEALRKYLEEHPAEQEGEAHGEE